MMIMKMHVEPDYEIIRIMPTMAMMIGKLTQSDYKSFILYRIMRRHEKLFKMCFLIVCCSVFSPSKSCRMGHGNGTWFAM